MKSLTVALSPSYPIYIGNNLLNMHLLFEHTQRLKKRLVIITDSNLQNNLGKNLQQKLSAKLLVFPAGEQHKTRDTKQQLEDQLLHLQCGRDTCLIALGGGVVTDLVGFVASTYCRGISTIYIPTTLLAMVDASIGGKTGVNTPSGKNLIGTFYQPEAVYIDINTLKTLPKPEFYNGMAEMIKHSLIADANIFAELKNNVSKIKNQDTDFLSQMIYASCEIKKNIVEQDEKETNLRQLLNFGHTIGHAIETIENYQISHGEAVAIGMLVECYLSQLCGFLPESRMQEITEILKDYDLPLKTIAFQHKDKLIKLLQLDKKSLNKTARFVLLDNIGRPHSEQGAYSMPVAPVLLDQALDWAAEAMQC